MKEFVMQVEDFQTFYEEVYGRNPFPWQQDLVREVAERGSWPALVDVPTGLGKTTMLDIAVFFAALDTRSPSASRIGRRRVFFVVDRRIVVDQAADHARHLATKLSSAHAGTVSWMIQERLAELSGPSASNRLLPVVRMRGGVTWDGSWISRPDQPGIVTGTVDQVGSRLFFRGYGVNSRSWSIDAALVGTDSLILVDEAHLATALTTSLASAQGHDSTSLQLGIPPAAVVQMSATARTTSPDRWTYTFDTSAHLEHATAAKRLSAAKSVKIQEATRSTSVKTIVTAAQGLLSGDGSRVLVVCNTIDKARAVHSLLRKTVSDETPVLLLIGRSRQFDREPIVEQALNLFGADRSNCSGQAILVATQTVEVGIDLDATALVTEVAAWDALVQRFGRVNRRGDQQEANIIVVDDEDLKPPVYGEAQVQTGAFLRCKAADGDALAVSPVGLESLRPPASATSPVPSAPLLLPVHLDAWTRTGPPPSNDAPLDAYLHGFDNGVAPVTIVWRDGTLDSGGERVPAAEATQFVNSVPVRSEEQLDVPLGSVRQWLTDAKSLPVSDWDDDPDWEVPFGSNQSKQVLRRIFLPDGGSSWAWITAEELRPGDLIVVPSQYGGLDEYGWNPSSTDTVVDVAELAALERGQPLLRLDQGLPNRLGLTAPGADFWQTVSSWQTTDSPEAREELAENCRRFLLNWLTTTAPTEVSVWSRPGRDGKDRLVQLCRFVESASLDVPAASGAPSQEAKDRFLLPTAVLRSSTPLRSWQQATDDSADGTVHTQVNQVVTLKTHGEAVAVRAQEIAEALRLSPALVALVTDAARWHDVGKVDCRFQAMLFDGDSVRAEFATSPRAKSGMPPGDLQRHLYARRRSGLPAGARHEAWSRALVEAFLNHPTVDYMGDTDLLLHLISSHHGHSRPLLPPVVDEAKHQLQATLNGVEVAADLPRVVDLQHAEIFHQLNERYGRWGLALLESIVRCADRTVSGEGS